jgi:hypothetical protein
MKLERGPSEESAVKLAIWKKSSCAILYPVQANLSGSL